MTGTSPRVGSFQQASPWDPGPLVYLGLYLGTVILGGALLAPPLYWLGQWGIEQDLVPQLRPFAFAKYLNRALMVLALGLLPLLLRRLGLRGWADLGLRSNSRRGRHLLIGLGLGAGGLAAVGLCLCAAEVLVWRQAPAPTRVLQALGVGLLVSSLEELALRGALLALLRRRLGWRRALAVLSLLFALLHFVQPNPALPAPLQIGWDAGLRLLPHLLWQFRSLARLATSFLTLASVGWVLGETVIRTRSLYLAIGLHAGWIAGLKLLSQATWRPAETLWLAADWRGGLAPTLVVWGTGALLIWGLRGPSVGAPEQESGPVAAAAAGQQL